MTIRILLGVALGLQCLFGVYLINTLSAVDQRLAQIEQERDFRAATTQPTHSTPRSAPDIDLIRQVFREETAALSDALSQIAAQSSATPRATSAPPRSRETDRIWSSVQRDIRAISAAGNANPQDLATLEANIAQLPADQRRQALSALSQTLSQPGMQGRF